MNQIIMANNYEFIILSTAFSTLYMTFITAIILISKGNKNNDKQVNSSCKQASSRIQKSYYSSSIVPNGNNVVTKFALFFLTPQSYEL